MFGATQLAALALFAGLTDTSARLLTFEFSLASQSHFPFQHPETNMSATSIHTRIDHTPNKAAGEAAVFSVLGIRVNAVQIPAVIRQMETWIGQRGPSRFIAVT